MRKLIIDYLEIHYDTTGWPWVRSIDICNHYKVSRWDYQEVFKELFKDGIIEISDSVHGRLIKLTKHKIQ